MTRVSPLDQEIMEARIDELRREVHMLERQLLLSSQNGQTEDARVCDGTPNSDATPLCVGAG